MRSRVGIAQLMAGAAFDAELPVMISQDGRFAGRLFQQRLRGVARQAVAGRTLFRLADERRIAPRQSMSGPFPLVGDVGVAVRAALWRTILHLALGQAARGQPNAESHKDRETRPFRSHKRR